MKTYSKIEKGRRYQTIITGKEYDTDAELDLSQWEEVFSNPNIFKEGNIEYLNMIYEQENHKATCFDIGRKYGLVRNSYNSITTHLAERICKYFNVSFQPAETDNKNSYWLILMKGRRVKNRRFEWEMRAPLVEAFEKFTRESRLLEEYDNSYSDTESEIINFKDGKQQIGYVTKYERNPQNRAAVIKIHGFTCAVCEFNFEKEYGETGKGFIEVHHINQLSDIKKEVYIDPKNDLVCLCSNCHRMIHRNKDRMLNVDELKNIRKKIKESQK